MQEISVACNVSCSLDGNFGLQYIVLILFGSIGIIILTILTKKIEQNNGQRLSNVICQIVR